MPRPPRPASNFDERVRIEPYDERGDEVGVDGSAVERAKNREDRGPGWPPWNPRNAGVLLLAVTAGPLVADWGFGVPLGVLAAPGAAMAGIPEAVGLPGLAAACVVGVGARRGGRPAALARGVTIGLAALLLGPLLALGRPLSWTPVAVATALWLLQRSHPVARAPFPGPLWLPALWALAMRIRPLGGGVVPEVWADRIAAALTPLGPRVLDAAPLLVAAVVIGLVRPGWRAAPGAAIGALLDTLSGAGLGPLSAAALGALAPVARLDGRSTIAMIAFAAACSMRLDTLERLRCDRADEQARVQRLPIRDPVGVAVAPGNAIELLVLGEGGTTLQRLTERGAVVASVRAEPPGGLLVSPARAGLPFLRVVPIETGLSIEWRDAGSLRVETRAEFRERCADRAAASLVDGSMALVCDDAAWRIEQNGQITPIGRPIRWLSAGPDGLASASGSSVVLGRAAPARRPVGSRGIAVTARRLLIASGPSGRLEVRGLPAPVVGLRSDPTDPQAFDNARLRDRLLSAPTSIWPEYVAYAAPQDAAWVWGPVEARIVLVDLVEPWQRKAVRLGAPPRAVAVDAGSGAIYAASRCGLTRARFRSAAPWEDG
jgi:hypothetical protein